MSVKGRRLAVLCEDKCLHELPKIKMSVLAMVDTGNFRTSLYTVDARKRTSNPSSASSLSHLNAWDISTLICRKANFSVNASASSGIASAA